MTTDPRLLPAGTRVGVKTTNGGQAVGVLTEDLHLAEIPAFGPLNCGVLEIDSDHRPGDHPAMRLRIAFNRIRSIVANDVEHRFVR